MIIKDNKFVIITRPKTIHFDLTKNVENNLKYNTVLSKNTITII